MKPVSTLLFFTSPVTMSLTAPLLHQATTPDPTLASPGREDIFQSTPIPELSIIPRLLARLYRTRGGRTMRKILRFCAMTAVFFCLSNIIVGAAAAQMESRTADVEVETEILKSWSRKINDATKRFEVLDSFNAEAVLDRETQLVWQREPQDQPFSSSFETDFFGAVRHC
jgi:hypothetical protein